MGTLRVVSSSVCLMAISLMTIGSSAIGDEQEGSPQKTDQNVGNQPVKLTGIGVLIDPPPEKAGKQILENGGRIFRLLPNGPAALSGELNVGDMIVAVAQGDKPPVEVPGMEFSTVISQIRGPTGTEVRLTIIPADDRFVKSKIVSIFREPLLGGRLVGKPAPDATFTVLADGSEQALSDLRGKVVLLDFWATNCVPCIEQIDAMQLYSKRFPNWSGKVALVTVSLDKDRTAAKEMISKRGWTSTHNVWGDEKLKQAFDANLLPILVILDPLGHVVVAGNPRAINIRKIVDRLLEK